MSFNSAIRIRHLSKCYAVFDKPVDRLKQIAMRGRKHYYREHWAVRDLSFEVSHGETVGIVGRNGSGKSTLLQMICGTLEPTTGEIEVAGRVAPLLQLGAGFNPEMTGRENVFINAAILGLSSQEIDDRFDNIAAFAEIGEMLERPVKHYSSGMYARLAFAVAINVDPDILVVDEALAVGDEMFQARCFARIRAMRDRGTTILFVSHSRGTILELCTRALLIDAGQLLLDGAPKPVTSAYQRLAFATTSDSLRIREQLVTNGVISGSEAEGQESEEQTDDQPHGSLDPTLQAVDSVEWPSYGARISLPVLRDTHGHEVNVLLHNETYSLEYFVDFDRQAFNVGFGMLVKTLQGHELAGLGTHHPAEAIEQVTSGMRHHISFAFTNLFAPGVYTVNVGCFGSAGDQDRYLHRRIDALAFRVDPSDDLRHVSGYIDISAHSEAATAQPELGNRDHLVSTSPTPTPDQ